MLALGLAFVIGFLSCAATMIGILRWISGPEVMTEIEKIQRDERHKAYQGFYEYSIPTPSAATHSGSTQR